MPSKLYSYEEYLELMSDYSGIKMQEESTQIIDRFRSSQSIPSHFAPVTFLLDFTTGKYIYMDESCLNLTGYEAGYYYQTGLNEFLKTWHPIDYSIINEKVFPNNLNFLQSLEKEKYAITIFSHNYRALNAKGEYVTVLQRFSYVPSNIKGTPAGMIGIAIDITHFKNDLSVIHTIEESIVHNAGWLNDLLYKKIYPIQEIHQLGLISKREIEILHHIAAGLSSKQIADKLNISINTINNHRKNMLLKTNCKSSAELINYSVKHGLL